MNILEITFDEIERKNLKNIINMINNFDIESIELSSSNEIFKIDLDIIKRTTFEWNKTILAKNYYYGYEPATDRYTQYFL